MKSESGEVDAEARRDAPFSAIGSTGWSARFEQVGIFMIPGHRGSLLHHFEDAIVERDSLAAGGMEITASMRD